MSRRAVQWRDSRSGYGLATRLLHWTMAGLFAWQFTTAILHLIDEDAAFVETIWWSHRATGFLLFLLVFLRGGWGIANYRVRPGHRPGILGRAANFGHLTIYALMILVPALALVRAYATGRGFTWFGIEVIAATGAKVEPLTAISNTLHGPLGWALLALILGHIAMSLVHHFVFRDATLIRMVRGSR